MTIEPHTSANHPGDPLDQPTRMPFGKYRGKPLSRIPASYLRWLVSSCHLSPDLRTAVDRRVERGLHYGIFRTEHAAADYAKHCDEAFCTRYGRDGLDAAVRQAAGSAILTQHRPPVEKRLFRWEDLEPDQIDEIARERQARKGLADHPENDFDWLTLAPDELRSIAALRRATDPPHRYRNDWQDRLIAARRVVAAIRRKKCAAPSESPQPDIGANGENGNCP